jgi:hypothetical protein
LQLGVAAAVGLELGARFVVVVAVDLDDQPRVPPERVDQLSFDEHVHLRLGKSRLANQREEPVLEL